MRFLAADGCWLHIKMCVDCFASVSYTTSVSDEQTILVATHSYTFSKLTCAFNNLRLFFLTFVCGNFSAINVSCLMSCWRAKKKPHSEGTHKRKKLITFRSLLKQTTAFDSITFLVKRLHPISDIRLQKKKIQVAYNFFVWKHLSEPP
jgi:hypothetical protein